MKNNSNPISQFSPHLFWDVNPVNLEPDRSKSYIIKRVLEYGLWEDWLLLIRLYGLETITNETKGYRDLDPKSLAFVSVLSGVPKEKFQMLQYQTIDTGTLELLKQLLSIELFNDLRLAGGTSLALQLGHCTSVDIDLFGKNLQPVKLLKSSNKNKNTPPSFRFRQ